MESAKSRVRAAAEFDSQTRRDLIDELRRATDDYFDALLQASKGLIPGREGRK